jgi:hypothetical protein
MTPGALVTAIVTTAFGFTLIIGSVAGSASAAFGQESLPLAAIATNRHAIELQAYHAVAAGDEAVKSLAAWNDPCEIAL